MSQYDIGTINPNTTSGTDLATLLTNFATAWKSTSSGSSRPSYIQPGGMWLDTSNASLWQVKLYIGSTLDAVMFTINTSSGVVSFGGTVTGGVGGNYVPMTRNVSTYHSVVGGGNLSADLSIGLLNDVASPGNNQYYGTDGSGIKGWRPLTSPMPVPKMGLWETPGTYNWTCPAGVTYAQVTVIAGGGYPALLPTIVEGGRATAVIPMTPGYNYTIIVGAGGTNSVPYGESSTFNYLIEAFAATATTDVNGEHHGGVDLHGYPGGGLSVDYRHTNGHLFGQQQSLDPNQGMGGLVRIDWWEKSF